MNFRKNEGGGDWKRAQLLNSFFCNFTKGWETGKVPNWFVTRSEFYHFVLYMACGGWLSEKSQI